MNRIFAAASKRIFPDYKYYAATVIRHRVKRIVCKKKNNKYVFILSAPLCGSTLLNEIFSTSNNVSTNNEWGTREGQKLPTTREMMFDHEERWNEDYKFDWKFIKREWRKYWDTTKPILVEKSPPNIIRTKEIEKTFNPSYFILLVRDPYAQCEGLMRRKNLHIEDAAQLVLERFRIQKENLLTLKHTLLVKYEDMCDETKSFKADLLSFLPELEDIDISRRFSSHNILDKQMTIENLNDIKIDQLSDEEKMIITSILKKEKALLNYFGYQLLN